MMVSIDLGVVSDPQPYPPPSSRAAVPPGTRRAIAAVLCLMLTGALLGASSRPAPGLPPEVRVATSPTDAFFLQGDRLYVVGPDSQNYTSPPRTITAYTAPGGERLWQHQVQFAGPINGLTAVGDVLLLHLSDPVSGGRMLVLDAETAAPRWSVEGVWPAVVNAESIVLGDDGDEGSGAPLVWRSVRTSTGEELWRREVPAGSYLQALHWRDGPMLAVLRGGPAEVWDVAGRTMGSVQPGEVMSLYGYGSVALAVSERYDGADIVAYTLPGLRRVWQRSFQGGTSLGDCGRAVVCVTTGTGEHAVAIDPATGTTLWENDEYGSFAEVGPILLAEETVQHTVDGTVVGTGTMAALDVRTGETLRLLGEWQRIRHDPEPDRRSLVVAQYDPLARTALIAEVDLGTLSLRVFGRIDGVGQDCLAQDRVMTCGSLDGFVRMWELPVAA